MTRLFVSLPLLLAAIGLALSSADADARPCWNRYRNCAGYRNAGYYGGYQTNAYAAQGSGCAAAPAATDPNAAAAPQDQNAPAPPTEVPPANTPAAPAPAPGT